jgi:uncharacterized SAM-binding protein YcdF (DUF218 family)
MRRFLVLIPLVIVLAIGTYVYIHSRRGTFTATMATTYTEEEFALREVTVSDLSILEVTSVTRSPQGKVSVKVRALQDGEASLRFGPRDASSGGSEAWTLRARKDGVIVGQREFDRTRSFEGWEAIHTSAVVLLGALVVLFAWGFFDLWRASWYGYTMVSCVSGLVFCLFQFLLFGLALRSDVLDNYDDMAFFMSNMVILFVLLSGIPMSVMAVLVSLSNLSLIRHEGMRPVNLLGVAASVVWAGFYGFLMFRGMRFDWPEHVVILLVYLVVAYGECLLIAIMVCAWLAAHHEPKSAMDYLVILGCGIRDDGTPCPLLAGRVDRAASFDKARQGLGDAPATFVPSGGQGEDEVISEAQSMANYLVDRWSVDPERIALEDRSVRTSENMAFSREVIERHAGRDASELKIGFATTNYHVFRGYVCAHQAGMTVEGMGSKTKYYFWPNAFLREFVGLVVTKRVALLELFVVSVLIYVVMSGALSMSVTL